jgi:pimeloyl-ACP methyl ester carboxylesterase
VLVDVDGRAVCARLRRPRDGSGVPVVLVAGGAGRGTDDAWGPVLEETLARIEPVLTYDRSGSGRSDGPQHGTVAGQAEELEQVRRAVGLDGPVIVVGWSLGGHVALGYALRHPEAVAGLVFVDPTPTEPLPQTAALRVRMAVAGPQMRLFSLASRAGAFSGTVGERLARQMAGSDAGPESVAFARRLLQSPDALAELATVVGRVPRYSSELRDALATTALPDVPAVVISADRRGGVTDEAAALVRASHEGLARRFPQGDLVIAEQATHQVPFDDPDVIVDAVRSMAAGV